MANDDRDQQRSGAGEQAAADAERSAPGQRPASQQAANEAAEAMYPPAAPAQPGRPGGSNGTDQSAGSPASPYGPPDGGPNPYGPIRYDPIGRYGAPNEYGADDLYGTYGVIGSQDKGSGGPRRPLGRHRHRVSRVHRVPPRSAGRARQLR